MTHFHPVPTFYPIRADVRFGGREPAPGNPSAKQHGSV